MNLVVIVFCRFFLFCFLVKHSTITIHLYMLSVMVLKDCKSGPHQCCLLSVALPRAVFRGKHCMEQRLSFREMDVL